VGAATKNDKKQVKAGKLFLFPPLTKRSKNIKGATFVEHTDSANK
jgi:hypothetical protein